jgi:hypothetical protein
LALAGAHRALPLRARRKHPAPVPVTVTVTVTVWFSQGYYNVKVSNK